MNQTKKVYEGRRPTDKMRLSNREIIIKRVFKMAVRRGVYEETQYHDFCNWAKGKSESALLKEIT